MPYAATWMDLEIVILSEVSQTEEEKYNMVSRTCGIQNTTQVNIPYYIFLPLSDLLHSV